MYDKNQSPYGPRSGQPGGGYHQNQQPQQGYGSYAQPQQGYGYPQAQPWQGYGQAQAMDVAGEGSLSDPAVLAFTKRVYGYFTAALATATGAAVGGMALTDYLIASGQGAIVTGLSIASFIAFFVSYLAVLFSRRSHSPLKTGLLFVFATASGFMLTPLLSAFVGAGMGMSVITAFGITTVGFFSLTVYVLATGKDFRSIGGLLLLGILLLLGVILMNLFVPFSGTMHRVITVFGILLFSGFILYDTSRVTRDYFRANDAVSAALHLFYDFVLLFRYVLYFMGSRR